MSGKAVFSYRHLPPWERLRVPCIVTARLTPLQGQAKEAQGVSCASWHAIPSRESAALIFLMSFRIAAEGKTALPEVFLFADIAFDGSAVKEGADIEE